MPAEALWNDLETRRRALTAKPLGPFFNSSFRPFILSWSFFLSFSRSLAAESPPTSLCLPPSRVVPGLAVHCFLVPIFASLTSVASPPPPKAPRRGIDADSPPLSVPFGPLVWPRTGIAHFHGAADREGPRLRVQAAADGAAGLLILGGPGGSGIYQAGPRPPLRRMLSALPKTGDRSHAANVTQGGSEAGRKGQGGGRGYRRSDSGLIPCECPGRFRQPPDHPPPPPAFPF